MYCIICTTVLLQKTPKKQEMQTLLVSSSDEPYDDIFIHSTSHSSRDKGVSSAV